MAIAALPRGPAICNARSHDDTGSARGPAWTSRRFRSGPLVDPGEELADVAAPPLLDGYAAAPRSHFRSVEIYSLRVARDRVRADPNVADMNVRRGGSVAKLASSSRIVVW
jgi:hypothetical protein